MVPRFKTVLRAILACKVRWSAIRVDPAAPRHFMDSFQEKINEKNGPHCLVPRTHKEKVPALWRHGHISDEQMLAHYPESEWDYQSGEAGSVFFVDTKAFHKGVPLIEGERYIVQFHYVDALFGEHLPLKASNLRFPSRMVWP